MDGGELLQGKLQSQIFYKVLIGGNIADGCAELTLPITAKPDLQPIGIIYGAVRVDVLCLKRLVLPAYCDTGMCCGLCCLHRKVTVPFETNICEMR